MSRFDPNQSVLAGQDPATLRQWLSDAQSALNALYTGQREVSISYDGKSVTYLAQDRGTLENWIYLLQRQLGNVRSRRAITPYFR